MTLQTRTASPLAGVGLFSRPHGPTETPGLERSTIRPAFGMVTVDFGGDRLETGWMGAGRGLPEGHCS